MHGHSSLSLCVYREIYPCVHIDVWGDLKFPTPCQNSKEVGCEN